jgi:hypothetical protein
MGLLGAFEKPQHLNKGGGIVTRGGHQYEGRIIRGIFLLPGISVFYRRTRTGHGPPASGQNGSVFHITG